MIQTNCRVQDDKFRLEDCGGCSLIEHQRIRPHEIQNRQLVQYLVGVQADFFAFLRVIRLDVLHQLIIG